MKKNRVLSLGVICLFATLAVPASGATDGRHRLRERDRPSLIRVIKKFFGISTLGDSPIPPIPTPPTP
jgi:hypothetical protein